jgi:hypothetical protein
MNDKQRDEGDQEQIEKLPPTSKRPEPEAIDTPQDKKTRTDEPPRI